ncbi:MAG TPA: winged helix-turn-helix domain-containing protein, partial [Solirubrobacteraceae bacterium]|nr:winged helix-turn-helix domain-containing protein [Solirubrobacteraceae bacterium]
GFSATVIGGRHAEERHLAPVPEPPALGDSSGRGGGRAKPGALRADLITALSGGPCTGEELARRTGGTQANLRYNLARLERTGLVVTRDQPGGIMYELRGEPKDRGWR